MDKTGDIFGFLFSLITVLLFFSLFLSFINAFTRVGPCNSYGYYLPATFVLCKLSEERK